jgi:hypothetical protein
LQGLGNQYMLSQILGGNRGGGSNYGITTGGNTSGGGGTITDAPLNINMA